MTASIRCDAAEAWTALRGHYEAHGRDFDLREAFARDPGRYAAFSVEAPEVFADLSKNRVDTATLRYLVELARECGLPAQRDALLHEPGARRVGVGHGLLRREGLAGDDEQRPLRIEQGQHARDVAAVDVAHEVQAALRLRVRVQRRHHHLRAQVAAADADVDDVGDGRVGAHALGVGQHGIEHAVHLGAEGPGAARRAQRGVQHGAAFGGVGDVAAQHRVAPRFQAAFTGQVHEEAPGGDVDQVLAEVGKDFGRLQAEGVEAARVAGEGLAQVQVAAMGLVMALQRGPGHGAVAAGEVHVKPL